jgi:hypothetical protein
MNMSIAKIKAKPNAKPNTKLIGINPAGREPVQFYSDPVEDDIILIAASAKEAYRLLKSEAEKLLDDGWEVIRISKRSYIAVQDGCEIYLRTCKKGVSARVFQYVDLL